MNNEIQDCTSARSVIRLLIRADKGARTLIDRSLQVAGLSCAQWLGLRLIREGVAMTPGALATELGINSGATRFVDCLEERGLLRRQRSTSDRRVVSVVLTEAGVRKLDQVAPGGLTAWRDVLGIFAPGEAELLQALLGRLVDAIEGRFDLDAAESSGAIRPPAGAMLS